MLMKPICRWHEKTIRTPIDSDAGPPFFPKKRITLTRENHYMRARAVSMASRISTGRILFEMSAHRIGSKVESDSRGSLTSQAAVLESKVSDISDKIGFPRTVACNLSSLSVEIPVFTIESVPEFKAVAENETNISETIDHLGRVSERDKAGCLGSLCIEVLVPSVQRRGKKASLLPLEGLFSGSLIPNARGAATFDNINQLFKEITLRLGFATRWNLNYIRTAGTPRPNEINKRSESAGALPGCDRNGGQIFYAMTAHDRNPLGLLP